MNPLPVTPAKVQCTWSSILKKGSKVVLVNNANLPARSYWRVAFNNHQPHHVMEFRFIPNQNSPSLTVTNGYIDILQTGIGAPGGDLSTHSKYGV